MYREIDERRCSVTCSHFFFMSNVSCVLCLMFYVVGSVFIALNSNVREI